jgi:hypothetical protein
MLEFVFEDQDSIDEFVQTQKLFQILAVFKPTDVGSVYQLPTPASASGSCPRKISRPCR